MARIAVGLNPIQVARPNSHRHQITVQLLPNSISAGNTGLVYGKFGSAPIADPNSNSWDFVLNSGAADGSNFYDASDEAYNKQDLWLVADTADQIVNVVETTLPSEETKTTTPQ
ncbi:hypothetical protein EPO14_01120 [Patescibacteria group bacterium]|nr:MAG: hypothetical protein EPO14_01120 [Patescibacteria group bacterium]